MMCFLFIQLSTGEGLLIRNVEIDYNDPFNVSIGGTPPYTTANKMSVYITIIDSNVVQGTNGP